jgi:hypothetical protein
VFRRNWPAVLAIIGNVINATGVKITNIGCCVTSSTNTGGGALRLSNTGSTAVC